jgi:hypothetical protein
VWRGKRRQVNGIIAIIVIAKEYKWTGFGKVFADEG